MTVKPYTGLVNPADLNFQLRADHVGFLQLNDPSGELYPSGYTVRREWSQSPKTYLLAAERNFTETRPYRAFTSYGEFVEGTITVNATPGRFMPPRELICSGVPSVDMSAGAEIPFANRVWSVIVSPDVQNGPTVDQQGVVRFDSIDAYTPYRGNIVRVTNAADPTDYIEGVLTMRCLQPS